MTVLRSLANALDFENAMLFGHSDANTQGAPLLPGTQLSNWADLLTIPSQYGALPDQMRLLAIEGQWFGTDDKNHRMSWVYSDDPLNPYGGYTFVYQLDVAQSPIDRMSFFANPAITASVAVVDSFYAGVSNGGLLAPSSIDRSVDGAIIGVNWDGGIPPGPYGWSSTAAVVLYTDMKEFHISPATFSYLGRSVQTANMLSVGPISEPETCGMMRTGLACHCSQTKNKTILLNCPRLKWDGRQHFPEDSLPHTDH